MSIDAKLFAIDLALSAAFGLVLAALGAPGWAVFLGMVISFRVERIFSLVLVRT